MTDIFPSDRIIDKINLDPINCERKLKMISGKNIKRLMVILLSVTILFSTYVYGAESNSGEAMENQPSLQQLRIRESMSLYKGETRFLDMSNVGGKASVKFTSSKPKVVSVTQSGILKAKKCGKAIISVEMKYGDETYVADIQVSVKISGFFHSKNYAKKMKKTSSNQKKAVLHFHKEIKPKKTSSIHLQGLNKTDKVTYRSDNTKVATVDKKGKVTAVKEGKANISITIKRGEETYKYVEVIHVNGNSAKAKITSKQVNSYFSKSAFIGNSIGVGQRMYFNSMGKGYLGGPTMLVKGCYSFANDKSTTNNKYKLTYKGKILKAKDAVAQCGAKRVFINMGTNDMYSSAKATYAQYVEYIKGIRAKNPKVDIFIESMTPVYYRGCKGSLNNKNVNELNSLLEKYCRGQKNIYYIDISTKMKDSHGGLKKEYTSDSYVHMTMAGYRVWTEQVVAYVKNLLISERLAEDAVNTAKESRNKADIKAAKKLVQKLEKGTVKSELSKKLKKI